jgi:cardiolipin synthase
MRLTGRVVRTLLRDFAKSYVKCGGLKKNVKHLLHPKIELLSEWGERIKFIMHSPGRSSSQSLRRLYTQALMTAKESVNLVTPYYIPDRKFLKLVAQASARGVRVSILLPERTDVRIIHWLAQIYFDITETAGAKFYFSKKMNHGKAITVDNTSALVGSVNMTKRSFDLDQESGIYFTEEEMVKELNSILDNWKKEATDNSFRGRKWNVPRRLRIWWENIVRKWI